MYPDISWYRLSPVTFVPLFVTKRTTLEKEETGLLATQRNMQYIMAAFQASCTCAHLNSLILHNVNFNHTSEESIARLNTYWSRNKEYLVGAVNAYHDTYLSDLTNTVHVSCKMNIHLAVSRCDQANGELQRELITHRLSED